MHLRRLDMKNFNKHNGQLRRLFLFNVVAIITLQLNSSIGVDAYYQTHVNPLLD